MTIRIGLVDDQHLVRAGFSLVINSQPDMAVVMEATDGAQALVALRNYECDVVLMDIRMPNVDGLEATRRITQAGPLPKVIILTTFDLDEYVLKAVKSGASGFLVKDAPPEEMLSAIRTVHAGDAVIAPAPTKRLLQQLARMLADSTLPDPGVIETLTERERQVLILMAHGQSNPEIAAGLYVAPSTVKTHVGKILSKLGARDRVQAVLMAYEAGLVHFAP